MYWLITDPVPPPGLLVVFSFLFFLVFLYPTSYTFYQRRFKAAFEAYLERELPELKQDRPGLRKNQMHDILFKQFQKAPENPFNQVIVAHNATKEERVEALQAAIADKEKRFKA